MTTMSAKSITDSQVTCSNEQPARQSDNAQVEDTRATQTWTQSGYPIVDGKYLDGNGVTQSIGDEWTMSGPPVIDVYWHNRRRSRQGTRAYFGSIGANAFVDLTEYLSRVGEFLRAQGHVCQIMSLNATPYSINVIVATELSTDEMGDLLRDYRLAPAN